VHVPSGLAIGLCVGMVLLAQQTGTKGPVELNYEDPGYIDWLDSAGLAEGLTPTNPVELPLGMYYPSVRCSRPPCGCCGEPYEFAEDPADTPSPEQVVIENYKMPADEVNLYKKAWNSFDGKRGGRIPTRLDGNVDMIPLAKLVRTLGTNPRSADLQYTLGQVDPDGIYVFMIFVRTYSHTHTHTYTHAHTFVLRGIFVSQLNLDLHVDLQETPLPLRGFPFVACLHLRHAIVLIFGNSSLLLLFNQSSPRPLFV